MDEYSIEIIVRRNAKPDRHIKQAIGMGGAVPLFVLERYFRNRLIDQVSIAIEYLITGKEPHVTDAP